AQRLDPVHQGFLVRESERAALAHAAPAAAGDQYSDQRQRQRSRRHRLRGRAEDRRQGRFRRQRAVRLRSQLRRRVPHPERGAGKHPPAGDDRMPAAVVPVRARDRRDRGARRRLPAAAHRPDRFRRALSAEDERAEAAAPADSDGVSRRVIASDPPSLAARATAGLESAVARSAKAEAKQSRAKRTELAAPGLLRRFAPRNDGYLISTKVTAFTRLFASTALPSRVTSMLRTMSPPPGIAQVWNFCVCGSNRTTVFGLAKDSLYHSAPLVKTMP